MGEEGKGEKERLSCGAGKVDHGVIIGVLGGVICQGCGHIASI